MPRRAQPPVPGPVDAGLRALLTASGQARVALARRLGLGLKDVEAMEHVMLANALAERTGEESAPLGPVQLSRRLGVTSAAATQALHRLEQAGHVRRVPHPQDGRRQVLAATLSGEAHVMSQLGPLLQSLSRISAALTPEEQRVVTTYLGAVTDVFTDFVEQGHPAQQASREG